MWLLPLLVHLLVVFVADIIGFGFVAAFIDATDASFSIDFAFCIFPCFFAFGGTSAACDDDAYWLSLAGLVPTNLYFGGQDQISPTYLISPMKI